MRLKFLGLIFFLLIPATALSQTEEPVQIILFSSANCKACQKVKEDIVPPIKNKYGDRIKIEELDKDKWESYLKLLELQDRYNWHPREVRTPTLFVDGKFLLGSDDIEKYLEINIDAALSKRGYVPIKTESTESSIDLISRFQLISPIAVISAGLIDGINPCAFTAIIFFISFLALQGYGRREILAIGLAFILAVFIIYVLIGLGLFSFLFKLKAYWVVVKTLYIVGALLCFILSGFAFYDFVKFRRTRQTQDLTLQLPPKLKEKIQQIIGFYYRKGKEGISKYKSSYSHTLRLILTAFIVGCLVSIFEAVCTGQVYLPTIVFVLKTTPLKSKAFSYLLIYNLVFILPLWLILLFALLGVTSGQFSKFAHKHIGTIKILMMALFLGLGLFLIWQ